MGWGCIPTLGDRLDYDQRGNGVHHRVYREWPSPTRPIGVFSSITADYSVGAESPERGDLTPEVVAPAPTCVGDRPQGVHAIHGITPHTNNQALSSATEEVAATLSTPPRVLHDGVGKPAQVSRTIVHPERKSAVDPWMGPGPST